MTTMVIHSANDTAAAAMTIGQLRGLLETFLHDGGNRWDHRIAPAMTAAAVTAALAHTNRPVRLVGATTGATAQIGLQAHSTGQPQEWTALSPIAEDALPRQASAGCGANRALPQPRA